MILAWVFRAFLSNKSEICYIILYSRYIVNSLNKSTHPHQERCFPVFPFSVVVVNPTLWLVTLLEVMQISPPQLQTCTFCRRPLLVFGTRSCHRQKSTGHQPLPPGLLPQDWLLQYYSRESSSSFLPYSSIITSCLQT